MHRVLTLSLTVACGSAPTEPKLVSEHDCAAPDEYPEPTAAGHPTDGWRWERRGPLLSDEVLYGVVEAETGRQGGKPSDHELRNYAKYIGVRESEFEDFGRSLAEEGLSAPLPQGWEQGKTPEKGRRR